MLRVAGWPKRRRTRPSGGRLRQTVPALAVACVCLAPRLPAEACSGAAVEPTGTDTHFPMMYGERPTVGQLMDLGRRIFRDAGLSASGRQSCASCHDPAHAYGPPDAKVVQPGGARLDRVGFRNAPSLTYLHAPIPFTQHFYESEVTLGRDDQGPTGGRTWDGRVDTGHDQALMPLLDPNEMANVDTGALFERLKKADYAADFRRALSAPGEDVFDDPESAVVWMTVALETFEQSAADFHPFSSKFDAWLRDEAALSPREQRGLALFNDMKKGNCASCHPSTRKSAANRPPLFTDFGYAALGVPRNRSLPANQDPNFFDLGLCGPLRTDLKDHPDYCGMFRTPTLRNVALRKNFFHNGAMHSLRDAVAFYATRDTAPRRWYGQAPASGDGAGHPLGNASPSSPRYDDLPPAYWKNVSHEVPFKPLPNARPRLSPAEIDDIVAFLQTLSDGYAAGPARPRQAGVDQPRIATIRVSDQ